MSQQIVARIALPLVVVLILAGCNAPAGPAQTSVTASHPPNQTTSLRPDAFPDMDTADAVNALRAAGSFHTTNIDLASITVPTLILYGEHEPSVLSRHAPTLSAQIPDSDVQEVPDAGHASPWDNPEFFNSTIRTFLTSRTAIEAE